LCPPRHQTAKTEEPVDDERDRGHLAPKAETVVLRVTELAGFIGTGLAGAAYVPQIPFYATKYAHSYCATHLPHSLVPETERAQ
jgi:hypothetical protein